MFNKIVTQLRLSFIMKKCMLRGGKFIPSLHFKTVGMHRKDGGLKFFLLRISLYIYLKGSAYGEPVGLPKSRNKDSYHDAIKTF